MRITQNKQTVAVVLVAARRNSTLRYSLLANHLALSLQQRDAVHSHRLANAPHLHTRAAHSGRAPYLLLKSSQRQLWQMSSLSSAVALSVTKRPSSSESSRLRDKPVSFSMSNELKQPKNACKHSSMPYPP